MNLADVVVLLPRLQGMAQGETLGTDPSRRVSSSRQFERDWDRGEGSRRHPT